MYKRQQLKGVWNLTRVVLEQLFIKDSVSSITNKDMEVFSSVVFHHLCRFGGGDHFNKYLILIDRYGIGTGEPKTIETLADEYSTTTEHICLVEQEALHQLKEAVLHDILDIANDIGNEDKE